MRSMRQLVWKLTYPSMCPSLRSGWITNIQS
nr:MAG TPA: hypothetical protein [Caudoviricetes sp.]